MMSYAINGGRRAGRFLVGLGVSALLAASALAQTNEPPAVTTAPVPATVSEAALDQARQEATAARTTLLQYTTQTEARFQQLQATLLDQRAAELDSLRAANRFTLLVAAGLSVLGFAGMMILAVIVWRIVGRRPVTALAYAGPGGFGAGAGGDAGLMLVNPVEQANARFLSAIEQLEKRIREMETSGTETPITVSVMPGAGGPGGNGPAPAPGTDAPVDPATAGQVEILLGKGQSLLGLGQVEAALACFVEALALDPGHPEAHLKKAAALEKLDRLDEALREYDEALTRDSSLTMAYLGKGGVFNRLERHSDALRCYEQALHTQHRAQVAE